MTVLRYNVGRQPPTREELKAIRERLEAHEREHYGDTGPATCPQCGDTFWSYQRSQVLACPTCNPPPRFEPANGRPHLPEHALGRPLPRDDAARCQAYRASRRNG
jgi:predicted Zn-ribbon and HTH transcriptional regulator